MTLRRVAMKRTPRKGGVTRLLYARVMDAWCWSCQGCGRTVGQCIADGLRLELNHRLPKGRGGRDEFVNLVPLCGLGNAAGCHRRVDHERAWATRCGLSVPSGSDPATTPVTDWQGTVWHLSAAGQTWRQAA